ncbi:hypothetical protein QT06_C0001G0372 [archaeon GW2011_AR15]|nr:hypothetical protein QT06_C0001G0372 [archaeon GW2011_AR15]
MKEKKRLFVILNILYIVLLLCITYIVTYYATPIHEFSHALPCKMIGGEPNITWGKTDCFISGQENNISYFLFYMGPYIFYLFVIVFIYCLYKKNKYLKYFSLLPLFDIVYNYFSSLKISDFSLLLQHTSKSYWLFGVGIVLTSIILTYFLVYKTQLFSVTTFLKDFNLEQFFRLNKNG